jgi:hypothetical protein
VSTSASSTVSTLPSTTAAFRLSPRSLARFIGEPLKAAENSYGVMPNKSRASVRSSFPTSAPRAANGGSRSSCEKRMFQGQQDWDVWRYNRFEIRLETGRNTLGGGAASSRPV